MKKGSLWAWLVVELLMWGMVACSGRSLAPTATSLPTFTPPTATATPLPAPTAMPPSPTTVPTLTPVPRLPDPGAARWSLWADGLDRPVGAYAPPGDTERLFVLEQVGRIRIVRQGQVLSEPFLDLRDRVGSHASEQGLLGLAFHPRYAENGYFFVNYTDRRGDTVVARLRVSADPNRADPASETVLLRIPQPYANHNGGHLAFGPDGYLYIGMGDGGSAGDPQGNAQNPHSLLGKLLRIDVDGGTPYAIPPDNPFVNGGGRPEVWALGLRNPWKFAFDPATGALFIGDVGQNAWEEIDYLPPNAPGGANFGWDYREGRHPYEGTLPAGVSFVEPVWEYGHDQGCSVTGGVVVRDPNLPAFWGVYLFGDYCSGLVWGLVQDEAGQWHGAQLFATDARITAFAQNDAGAVWLVAHQGQIYRLTAP